MDKKEQLRALLEEFSQRVLELMGDDVGYAFLIEDMSVGVGMHSNITPDDFPKFLRQVADAHEKEATQVEYIKPPVNPEAN